MNKKLIFTITLLCFTSLLPAGEIQTGKGTFEMTGGFFGLDQTQSTDITTTSLVQNHKNLFGSTYYYAYDLAWYDSDFLVQGQQTINNPLPLSPSSIIPSMDYRMQGLDVNLVFGKDISHKDENNYLSAGLLIGISVPWIDSKDDDSNDDDNNDNEDNNDDEDNSTTQSSKTKIYTYKIGPSISARTSLGKYFSLYTNAAIAYQTGHIENSYANIDSDVNGMFKSYDIGIKFLPLSEDFDLGLFTLSPRFYATLGYKYSSWDLNDINIDATGQNIKFTSTDFNMNSKTTYFGLGYDF